LYKPPPPKEGEIKIDSANLPKINLVDLGVPPPPKIKTIAELKKEEEAEKMKGTVAFNLRNQYDLSTYWGRFLSQVTANNPINFFHSEAQI
jgi:hypothetical protein